MSEGETEVWKKWRKKSENGMEGEGKGEDQVVNYHTGFNNQNLHVNYPFCFSRLLCLNTISTLCMHGNF